MSESPTTHGVGIAGGRGVAAVCRSCRRIAIVPADLHARAKAGDAELECAGCGENISVPKVSELSTPESWRRLYDMVSGPAIARAKGLELADEVRDLRKELANLTGRMESNGGPISRQDLDRLNQKVERVSDKTNEISAPVHLPALDEMAVQLVPAATLQRYQEYHADEPSAQTWLGVFVGAILGIVINIVTQAPSEVGARLQEPTLWVVAVILGAVALMSHRQADRARTRQERLRAVSAQLNKALGYGATSQSDVTVETAPAAGGRQEGTPVIGGEG